MKKAISLIAVMVLVCFSSMVFAADAAAPTAPPAQDEAVKAVEAKGEVIEGKIQKKERKHFAIFVNGRMIGLTPEMYNTLKKGYLVKITLSATNPSLADKVEVINAKKEPEKAEGSE